MIINVRVKPNSFKNKLEKIDEKDYLIFIREKPIDGKANNSIVKILSKEFGVSPKNIKIKTPRSRKKIIEIIL